MSQRYLVGMVDEPENLTLRMLIDMRSSHAAAMDAVQANMRAMSRMMEQLGSFIDRIDAIEARLIGFQAETGKTLRMIQSDVIAMENQNIARHGETINLLGRVRILEAKFGMPIGFDAE